MTAAIIILLGYAEPVDVLATGPATTITIYMKNVTDNLPKVKLIDTSMRIGAAYEIEGGTTDKIR